MTESTIIGHTSLRVLDIINKVGIGKAILHVY
jgi:hypothetical protein